MRTLIVLLIALASTACTKNTIYRPDIPPAPQAAAPHVTTCAPSGKENPATCSVQVVKSQMGEAPREIPIAFIEFDDIGQTYKRGQMAAAEQMIHDQHPEKGDVVTILFIHGWENNASDNSNNVPGFRDFLQKFQLSLPKTKLVGVYFGWRGEVTSVPVAQEFTYWNRRDTASYIPGSNMSEALLRVAAATKGSDYCGSSSLIVAGHSFGGLVLERTVTQYITRRIVEHPPACQADQVKHVSLFADLIVFVNEAAAATEAIQLLTMLNEKAEDQSKDPRTQHFPAIVSITSTGDTATRFFLPVGQGANLLTFRKSLRHYGKSSNPDPKKNDPDPFGTTDQTTYYLRSAAHISQLQSHVVESRDSGQSPPAEFYTCAVSPGAKQNYYVVRNKTSANTTPYWIMEMPTEIVPDHTHIFRPQFGALLAAFVLRQADPKFDPTTCYDISAQPNMEMKNMRQGITLK
jgi:hypothetical protein